MKLSKSKLDEYNSSIFSEDGNRLYGANQGSLKAEWEDLLKNGSEEEIQAFRDKIQLWTVKEMTDDEITKFLNTLNTEGCGYAAAANIILNEFAGREEEFEEKFGISYYDEDGNVNFNELLVDFYINKDNTIIPGTISPALEANIKDYCNVHGVDIKGNILKLNDTSEIDAALAEGKLVVASSLSWDLIAPEGQNVYKDNKTGSHFITIVGYDKELKMYVVSSWGRKYYLYPNSISFFSDAYAY